MDSHNAGRGICDAGKEEKLTKKQEEVIKVLKSPEPSRSG